MSDMVFVTLLCCLLLMYVWVVCVCVCCTPSCYTKGACSMVVPAMSTRPRTSALRMPSTHPTIMNANHR